FKCYPFFLNRRTHYLVVRTVFEKAARIEPKNFRALYDLGRILRMTGECKKALYYFEAALLIERNTSDIYFEAALCYVAGKDFKKAGEYLTDAIRLSPERKDYTDLLKQLNR
ncbi:MAG: hypothetical protein PHC61_18440, partial [Chitinivibrionales bacterium]|nr:hypothetical protein [Chitinivibrionales bacterium]